MDYTQLNNRIDHMFETSDFEFLDNMNICEDILNKLCDYQHFQLFNLITSLRTNKLVLNGSDTGTGKTYVTIAICKHLRLKPFIICPHIMISTWIRVCEYFEVEPLCIVNYESIKKGKLKNTNNINAKYITLDENFNNDRQFIWNVPKYTLIVFDEAHHCKSKNSLNGKLLLSTKRVSCKTMLLSATISDKPESFYIFGYMLDLYRHLKQANNWMKTIVREEQNSLKKIKGSLLAKYIFPIKGCKIKIAELGDKFPKNHITADCYHIKDEDKRMVNSVFDDVGLLTGKLIANKENSKNILNEIQAMRQKLELIKVDIICKLVNEYLENDHSPVIFVNFRATIEVLMKKLNTTSVIIGQQKDETRDENINNFQNNVTNVIICSIDCAAEGISLHDLYGRPRVALISPPHSSIKLEQVFGRICRTGALSSALQRIIYCAGTCEEVISNRINEKLKFKSTIFDDDMITIDKNKI